MFNKVCPLTSCHPKERMLQLRTLHKVEFMPLGSPEGPSIDNSACSKSWACHYGDSRSLRCYGRRWWLVFKVPPRCTHLLCSVQQLLKGIPISVSRMINDCQVLVGFPWPTISPFTCIGSKSLRKVLDAKVISNYITPFSETSRKHLRIL